MPWVQEFKIENLWNRGTGQPNNISDHVLQFTHLTGGGVARHSLCNLYGFYVSGLFGMNVITVCLIMLLPPSLVY
ncbi:hypothetical protein MtrunA17_Chr7g0249281 [Medicago truncatula]|uniref:Transmembrane protein n=1 Tax=Medicago truncatula TaxID=3880 RepID=A0A396H3P2_MEDTR|nr:hypothetical protein MtrunA17_Chr7g0249281 [Medicago truncatula]